MIRTPGDHQRTRRIMTHRSSRQSAQRAVQTVWVTAGRLSSRLRMLPGFLIVGAQRCGTTTMHRALAQHPAVLRAVLHKEVHFFDVGYQHKLGWYRAHFPLRARAHSIKRTVGLPPVAFESSPYYMFHPLAAGRIARDLPGVRLLVLVRDPVARALSAHAHELAEGFESEPFERALALEDARLEGEAQRILRDPCYFSHSYMHHAYRTRGEYIDQLERLEALVGRERIHVVDSGDFFAEPEPVYDAVLDFLGLPHLGYPKFGRHNASAASPIPESLRSALDAHFLPYDARLGEWLKREPSWRR